MSPEVAAKCEILGRHYAAESLGLGALYVERLAASYTWILEDGVRVVFVQFYDADVYQPLPEVGFEAMLGGFPAYFTVNVDVQSWKVIGHYAARE